MKEFEKYELGDIFYFIPEEILFLVVVSGDDGIKYIELNNLQFDVNNNVIATYASYSTINEWTIYVGNVKNISESILGK